jgi:hypothetical protein
MSSATSSAGSKFSSTGSFSWVSSSDRVFPMDPRWVREDRSHRGATGGRQAMPRPPRGCKSSGSECRTPDTVAAPSRTKGSEDVQRRSTATTCPGYLPRTVTTGTAPSPRCAQRRSRERTWSVWRIRASPTVVARDRSVPTSDRRFTARACWESTECDECGASSTSLGPLGIALVVLAMRRFLVRIAEVQFGMPRWACSTSDRFPSLRGSPRYRD